jgi:hypothetical protein
MSEKKELQMIFKDNLSNNYLEYKSEDPDILWLEKYFMDDENCLLFTALLQTSIKYFSNNNYNKFRQWVSYNTWNEFLNKVKFWQIIKIDPIYKEILIECNINNAVECLIESFLIEKEQEGEEENNVENP